MKANVNDRVIYDGAVHTVLRVHVTYELDGICIPVDDCEITLVQTKSDEVVMDELCQALGMTVRDIWMRRQRNHTDCSRDAEPRVLYDGARPPLL